MTMIHFSFFPAFSIVHPPCGIRSSWEIHCTSSIFVFHCTLKIHFLKLLHMSWLDCFELVWLLLFFCALCIVWFYPVMWFFSVFWLFYSILKYIIGWVSVRARFAQWQYSSPPLGRAVTYSVPSLKICELLSPTLIRLFICCFSLSCFIYPCQSSHNQLFLLLLFAACVVKHFSVTKLCCEWVLSTALLLAASNPVGLMWDWGIFFN